MLTKKGTTGDDLIDVRGEPEGYNIDGDRGNDTIHGSQFGDYIVGGWDTEAEHASWSPNWAHDGSDEIFGHGGNDVVHGWGENDRIDGGDGDDYATGDAGDDTLIGAAGEDYLVGWYGADEIQGGDGHDSLNGQQGDDELHAGAGNDLIHADDVVGKADSTGATVADDGNDYVDGGDGYDIVAYYNFSRGVTVDLSFVGAQDTGLGHDTLVGIEHVLGTVFSDVLTGDDGDNNLQGVTTATSDRWSGPIPVNNDTLSGGGGDDLLSVGKGNHILDGGIGSDTVGAEFAAAGVVLSLALQGQNQTTGQGSWRLTAVENLSGSAYNDVLTGDAEANVLAGAAGSDTLRGGAGNDTLLGDGVTAQNYSMGHNWLDYDHTQPWKLAGPIETRQDGDGDGADHLDGGAGDDIMAGGLGNDTYVADSAGDVAFEAEGAGTDAVRSSVSYTLGANLENLVLTGSAAINGTGNAGANTLTGNALSNLLDGGTGADVMDGKDGNDTYVVDNAGDKAVETSATGGTDTVRASINWSLAGTYVEILELTGSATTATGNGLANRLVGNAAGNLLNGAEGADRMIGALGDDTYVVDNLGDTVVELAGEGTDTVRTTISYSISGQHVENIVLGGSLAIDATGNGLANNLTGNGAANRLNGGTGADTMEGKGGNDIYVVDNAGDKVVEGSGLGLDTVETAFTYTLGTYVENLTLTGGGNAGGTGNASNNTIRGNSGANALNAGAGADLVYGGLGSDSLTGGTGLDGFYFDTALGATNVDKILDFSVADDTIHLSRSVFAAITVEGGLSAAAFTSGTAATTADHRIVYDSATGKIFYDADGSGSGAAVLFAQVTAGTALTNLDFTAYGKPPGAQPARPASAAAPAPVPAHVPADAFKEEIAFVLHPAAMRLAEPLDLQHNAFC